MEVWGQNRGITLVELLCALAILLLLLAGLLPLWQMGLRIWEYQMEVIGMQQDSRMALDYMCRELRRAKVVGIAANSRDGNRPMLQLQIDYQDAQGQTRSKTVNYFKYVAGTDVWREAINDANPGLNYLISGINRENGFEFYITDAAQQLQPLVIGDVVDGQETVTLILRVQRNGVERVVSTTVAPRN